MAETLKLPKQIINSDWKDDVGDYAIYGNNEKREREYISPTDLEKTSIERIKNRKIGRISLLGAFQKQL